MKNQNAWLFLRKFDFNKRNLNAIEVYINLWIGRIILKFPQYRINFYEKLLAFLEDGIAPYDAISRMSSRMEKSKHALGYVFSCWKKALRDGRELSAALEGWVPSSDRAMIGAGESSGNLVSALRETIVMNQSNVRLSRAVKSAVLPSIFQLIMLFAAIAVVALFVAPELRKVAPPEIWPPITSAYFSFTDFVIEWGDVIILVIVAFFLASFSSFAFLTGKIRNVLDRLPMMPWSIYRDIVGAHFLITISAMMRSGMQIDDALLRIRGFSTKYMTWHIDRMRLLLRHGRSEGEALNTGLFNKSIVGDLEDFAGLAGFTKAIDKIGRRADENARAIIEGRAKALGTAVLVSIFGFVGFTFASVASLIMAFFEKNSML